MLNSVDGGISTARYCTEAAVTPVEAVACILLDIVSQHILQSGWIPEVQLYGYVSVETSQTLGRNATLIFWS